MELQLPPHIDTPTPRPHPPRMTSPTPPARYWPVLFWAAAGYNFLIGVPGLVAPGAEASARIVSLFVCCFGLLYALVARDPVRFGPALWAGVAGKVGVVAIMLPLVLSGAQGTGQAAAIGAVLAGDALFTLAFLAFLLRRR